MSIAVQRTHDAFYVKEDRSKTPKEYFKFLANLTESWFQKHREGTSPESLMDIGCASGDFLYYLHERFPNAALAGIDVMPELIKAAKNKVMAQLSIGDINATSFESPCQFDVVYLPGVHSIFDSCDQWTKNFVSMIRPKGLGIVFGLFNPLPYDVLVKVKESGSEGAYEPGWNCFSRETVAAAFKANGYSCEFINWDVPLDIARNTEDGLRSWTTPMADGKRLTTNGTRIIHDFYAAIITR